MERAHKVSFLVFVLACILRVASPAFPPHSRCHHAGDFPKHDLPHSLSVRVLCHFPTGRCGIGWWIVSCVSFLAGHFLECVSMALNVGTFLFLLLLLLFWHVQVLRSLPSIPRDLGCAGPLRVHLPVGLQSTGHQKALQHLSPQHLCSTEMVSQCTFINRDPCALYFVSILLSLPALGTFSELEVNGSKAAEKDFFSYFLGDSRWVDCCFCGPRPWHQPTDGA